MSLDEFWLLIALLLWMAWGMISAVNLIASVGGGANRAVLFWAGSMTASALLSAYLFGRLEWW